MGWTLTTRDATQSKIIVESYAGSAPPPPFGNSTNLTGKTTVVTNLINATTGCAGTATQTTDAASHVQTNCYDALGRLTSVKEADNTVTNYSYNVLNNLTGVAGQTTLGCPAGQLRCFSYSSLSRLTSATNPESGTVGYEYDKNGNVTTLTDARGTMINFNPYDALNRLKAKTYTLGAQTAATESVCYEYDSDFKGALSSVKTFSGTGTCASPNGTKMEYTHDVFGRVTSSTQTTGSTAYPFSYQYSLRDVLTQITYPSGRKVGYVLDAADRIQTVTNVNALTNYASFNYNTAPGNTLTMTLGNGVVEKPSFNDRFQPTGLAVSSQAGNLLTLGFSPCVNGLPSCTDGNVGNLQSQTITIPGLNVKQTYTYDNLNRLTGATEDGAGWTQNYGYVGNGNRWVSTHQGGLPPLPPETPTAASAYTSSPVPNRINSWDYDANGNVLTIPIMVGTQSRGFTYDAENRQVTATINTGTTITASYGYDGLGQRVSKTTSGGQTTFVYDAFGNLAAEYGPSDPSPCGTPTCYVTVDHLGSTRMLTDSTGLLTDGNAVSRVRRYDYQPFGGEILVTNGGARTTAMGYQGIADGLRPKFTGKNRDAETALDWFEVRHLSGAQGRFQSVDPANAGAVLGNPQTWNGYAYVGNNPLSYTDPSGMFISATAVGAASGGPFGAILGAAIDIGVLFGGLFGFGGGSSPALAGFPFPNQFPIGMVMWDQDQDQGSTAPYDIAALGGALDLGVIFFANGTASSPQSPRFSKVTACRLDAGSILRQVSSPRTTLLRR